MTIDVDQAWEKARADLRSLADLRDRAHADLLAAGKPAFEAACRMLFARHGGALESFEWPQYTQYFNDGDPCEFSTRYEDCLRVNGIEVFYPDESEADEAARLRAAADDILEVLGTFDEDVYQHMFGDHVLVTVTRTGVTAGEYDHD